METAFRGAFYLAIVNDMEAKKHTPGEIAAELRRITGARVAIETDPHNCVMYTITLNEE